MPPLKVLSFFAGLILSHPVIAAEKPPGRATDVGTPEKAVAKVGAEALMRDAWATQRNVVVAVNERLPHGTPVDYQARIAPEHWGAAVRALKPQYVYFDGVNIVIILETSATGESGLYVELPITSSGFNAKDQASWSGHLVAPSVFAIARKGKQDKPAQPIPAAAVR